MISHSHASFAAMGEQFSPGWAEQELGMSFSERNEPRRARDARTVRGQTHPRWARHVADRFTRGPNGPALVGERGKPGPRDRDDFAGLRSHGRHALLEPRLRRARIGISIRDRGHVQDVVGRRRADGPHRSTAPARGGADTGRVDDSGEQDPGISNARGVDVERYSQWSPMSSQQSS